VEEHIQSENERKFEQMLLHDGWCTIKQIHTDNGTFTSQVFEADLHLHGQKGHFSGVGVHHQNGVAERSIKTVAEMDRSMMQRCNIHVSIGLTLLVKTFGLSLWITLAGCGITLPLPVPVDQLWNYSMALNLDAHKSVAPEFGVVQHMSLTQSYKMESRYPSGSPGLAVVSSSDAPWHIHLLSRES